MHDGAAPITVGHFQRFEFPAGMRENFRISSWKMRENAEIFKIRNSVLFSICEGKISLNEKSRELINAEAGILLLDDTINYLRRTGKIKYSVSVRRYN